MNLLKGRIAAFCLVGLTLGTGLLGCNSQQLFSEQEPKKTQDQARAASNTADNNNEPSPAPASRSSATGDSPAAAAKPVSMAEKPLPAGYALDETCEIGTGQTGLDIYYKLAPSDFLRFACVHRVDASPYIDYGDSAFLQNLADVGGPFCAFSNVSDNVGCALTPITPSDLMNVATPAQEEQEERRPVRTERPKQSEQPKQSKQAVEREEPTPDQQPVPADRGTGGLSNDKYYENVDGNKVHSPAHSTDGSVPEEATAQCADGTYSFSQHRSGTCSSHGGVDQWLR